MNQAGYQEVQPQGTCTQCSSPFPYVCHGCKSTVEAALIHLNAHNDAVDQAMIDPQDDAKRIYVGSGEDMHPSIYSFA